MKLGLILEGGASRTVFSCGVMDALIEENIKADVVVGSSAGISYGVSYASWQKGRNKTIASDFMCDKRYMGMRHLFNKENKSYYNIDFVFNEMPKRYLPYDFEGLKNYPGKTYAAVTNMVTGKPEYLYVPPEQEGMTKVLVASCSLPVLFPIAEIDGVPYMDGGIADAIPYEFALQQGCDKLIFVLTRQADYVKKKEVGITVARLFYKQYPNFIEAIKRRADMYNAEIKMIEKLEKEGKAFVFRPTDIKGIGRTENNPKKLVALFDQGYAQAKEKMGELKEFLQI